MTCSCVKGKTCPECLAAADLVLEPGRVSSPAFYEERIRLLEEKLRFVQQQNGALRIEIARLGGTE